MNMNTKIICAMVMAVLLLSCEKKVSETGSVYEESEVSLEIVMAPEQTRSSDEGDEGESSMSDYQVLIYDSSSRMLETYAVASSGSVEVKCTRGQKEIVVLANAPDVSSALSYDDLLKAKSYLKDNSLGSFVMEGYESLDLTSDCGTVVIDVRRIVSKVVLTGVTVDFENDRYDEQDFILKRLYLTNVPGFRTYFEHKGEIGLWYNQDRMDDSLDEGLKGLLYQDIADFNMKNERSYETRHQFYTYPNPYDAEDSGSGWTPRPTRLVVEAQLGEDLYYYPVTLPKLNQNIRYHVSLHIARPGALNPDEDMEKQAAVFTVNVLDWQGTEVVTESI